MVLGGLCEKVISRLFKFGYSNVLVSLRSDTVVNDRLQATLDFVASLILVRNTTF